MTELVRSAVLTNFVAVAQSLGLDPYRLVRAAGLSLNCLTEPEMRVPVAAVRQLLEDAALASGAENFGLRMAETRKLSTMGLVGAVTRDAPTLRHALQVMTRYMRAHNEALALRIEEEGGYATIRDEILVHGPGQGSARQAMELSIGALVRIVRVLLGDDWVPERVYFVHPAPADLGLHRRLFNCRVEFGSECNGIVCQQRDLDRPIAASDPILARYAQAQLESSYPQPAASMAREVRQLAAFLLPTGRCSIDQVARHLSVDRRTVHRQLAKEQTTFSDIVKEMRVELSQRYLEDGGRPLSGIAVLLGFSGSSALAKWHTQQFGMTPSQRRQLLAGRSAG